MNIYSPIRLVIADDHEVYRDGLRTLLQKSADIQIVGEASNGKILIEITERVKPDVILTDIVMPVMDGVEAVKSLHEHRPEVNIIALSMFNQHSLILEMLEAGASGYLIKNANKNEIIEAIHSVNRNTPYYCRSTSLKLIRHHSLGSTALIVSGLCY